jgi:hypothetical protein
MVADAEDTAPPMDDAHEGRDARGRFAVGNAGGPGNPFARQVAQLRRVLVDAFTEQDMQRVARQLIEQAAAGDIPSARLLFSYTLGQPAAPVDPDTLDQHEWAIHRQTPVLTEDLLRIIRGLPVSAACDIVSALAPYLEAIKRKEFADGLRMDDASFAALVARAQAQGEGADGAEDVCAPPSTNRGNGRPAPAATAAAPRTQNHEGGNKASGNGAAPGKKPTTRAAASLPPQGDNPRRGATARASAPKASKAQKPPSPIVAASAPINEMDTGAATQSPSTKGAIGGDPPMRSPSASPPRADTSGRCAAPPRAVT